MPSMLDQLILGMDFLHAISRIRCVSQWGEQKFRRRNNLPRGDNPEGEINNSGTGKFSEERVLKARSGNNSVSRVRREKGGKERRRKKSAKAGIQASRVDRHQIARRIAERKG